MNQRASTSMGAVFAGVIGLVVGNTVARASGFALPELSTAGVGTSNALVANPEEPGAFPYNPAAMGFHDSSSVAVGGMLIGPEFSVKTLTGTHDSDGSDWTAVPMIQGALKVRDKWRLGLGINAPFGLETRWQLGTFPKLSVPIPIPGTPLSFPAGLDHPDQSKLELVSIVPTLAFKVNDNLSIAAGADYYNAKTTRLNTHMTKIEGDGDGWGWNASLLFKKAAWSFGLSYHSAATVGVDVDILARDPVLLLLGSPPRQKAEVDLNLPWRLQLGVRYAVNDRLALEVDWTRTGWSEFDELKLKSKATGALIRTDRNNWDDASAYRFGLTYDLLTTTQLRVGYSYDETGQGKEYFSARVPDNDRHLFSIGLGHGLANGWAVEGAYMYVRFKDRSFSGDKPYIPTQDVNGTDALDGNYEGSAHVVALELRKAF